MGNETYRIPVTQTDEHETKLKITRRGKVVRGIAIVAGSVLAAGAVVGTAVEVSHAINEVNNPTTPELSGETVVVMPGDTLWSIAEDLHTGHDPRDIMSALEAANPLIAPGQLMPGDVLEIPVDVTQWMQQHEADMTAK